MIINRLLIYIFVIFFSIFYISSPVFASFEETQTSLPQQISNNVSYSFSNKIYLVGGSTSDDFSSVFSSHVSSNGNIEGWSSSTSLPYNVYFHSSSNKGNKLYIIGGNQYPPTQSINNVYIGTFADTDNILWEPSYPIPQTLAHTATVINGNYIYVIGGLNQNQGNSISQNIYFNEIDNDGKLMNNTWITTNGLPVSLYGHQAFAYSNYIYVTGGISTNGYSNNIYRCTTKTDGSISECIELSQKLPFAIYDPFYKLYEDNIVIFGGWTPSGLSDQILTTKINSDGSINEWVLNAQKLMSPICCGGIEIINKYVYLLGGYIDGDYTNRVTRMNLEDIIPSPNPTIIPKKNIIVLVPGMGGSWNDEALVHNVDKPNTEWRLTPFVNVYDGFITALKNSGYEMNKDLFVYAYDWRRNINNNVASFKDFVDQITSKLEDKQKIDILAHSMGGLIASSYMQNNPSGNIDKVLAIGTPFKGSLDAYKAWEGGDMGDMDIRKKLLVESVLWINRQFADNKIDVLRRYVPSIQNLLPTEDYLRDRKDKAISVSKMVWKNNFLPINNVNNNSSISAILSDSINTAQFYKIRPRNTVESLLELWRDGKPTSTVWGDGDGTVLTISARIADRSKIFSGINHALLLNADSVQEEIGKSLNIDIDPVVTENNINDNAIFITIASPATFTVSSPSNKKYLPQDNMLIINNPDNGDYKIHLTATGEGEYTVFIGRGTKDKTTWQEIKGNFSSTGDTQENSFQVQWSDKNLGLNLLSESILQLKNLQTGKKLTDRFLKAQIQLLISWLEMLDKSKNKHESSYIYRIESSLQVTQLILHKVQDKRIRISEDYRNQIARALQIVTDYLDSEYQNAGGK